MSDFSWPWQYNFPPFFTLQENKSTREKQLDAWCSLILDYHRHHRIFKLNINEALGSSLFNNKSINRRLSEESLLIILSLLNKKGNVRWIIDRKQCYVSWKTPSEWADLIYKWASKSALIGSVSTFYEILEGDDTTAEEFHGIEMEELKLALNHLQSQNKAQIISSESDGGVKFL